MAKNDEIVTADLSGAPLERRELEIGLGVVAPFDFVLDREYWDATPPGVSLHITRTPFLDEGVGVDLAHRLSDDAVLAAATRELLVAQPAVTVFACTSGSFVDGLAGELRCRKVMEQAGAHQALTTSGALLDALRALGVERVGVATPYDAPTTQRLVSFLSEAKIRTVSSACLGLTGDIFRVGPGSVRRLIREADHPNAEAIFVSCTNLWTLDVLEEMTRSLRKPVLSANLVTMWAALHAIGRSGPVVDRLLPSAS
jgi:maleate isomerase